LGCFVFFIQWFCVRMINTVAVSSFFQKLFKANCSQLNNFGHPSGVEATLWNDGNHDGPWLHLPGQNRPTATFFFAGPSGMVHLSSHLCTFGTC
jgi:hypothetical protein